MKLKLKQILIPAALMVSFNAFSQQTASNKTEVIEYVSAVYDPISEEAQVHFKTANNEKRIFYCSSKDQSIPEAFFMIHPATIVNNELTNSIIVGKKYKVSYSALTKSATSECCFKMKSYEQIK